MKALGTQAPELLVTYEKSKNALRLTCVSEAASHAGLSIGLSLADARARVPEIVGVPAEPEADAQALLNIADWCWRYTPIVVQRPPASIILDITGCAHLFGGEQSMLNEIAFRLAGQGFMCFASIAETATAALALAWSHQQIIVPQGKVAEAVSSLPLKALGIESEQVDKLKRSGLRLIHDLASRPRAPLAARFGAELLNTLDRALGKADEGLKPHRPQPDILVEQCFAEPMLLEASIMQTISLLAERVAKILQERAEGAKVLQAFVYRVDGVVRQVTVQAGKPIQQHTRMAKLFAEKLGSLNDEWNVGYGFDLVQLHVVRSEKISEHQSSLDHHKSGEDSIAELIDQLGARVGHKAIRQYQPLDSHLPEIAACALPAIRANSSKTWPVKASEAPTRPLTYFHPPEPIEAIAEVPDGPPMRFKWRKVIYMIAKAEGPERIADEWWHQDKLTRDYFRVEDTQGHRFWLYREGLYHFETNSPRWFMQGLFA